MTESAERSSSSFKSNPESEEKEEGLTVNTALKEYFKLKAEFENENNIIKKQIINNENLSKKEKHAAYLQLKPKCINCRQPSRTGTVFSNSFNKADYNFDSYRTLKASCGNLEHPCNLNIKINLGHYEPIDDLMREVRDEITEYKNKIINDKNKILFGLIKTETAIKNFEDNKEMIEEYTTIYEEYLHKRNTVIDNSDKKIELDETMVQSYLYINQLKECIVNMNKTKNTKFALDAVVIYNNTLVPLLDKIRHLKYGETDVNHDDTNNTCNLIQHKNKISDLLFCGYADNVSSYDVGYKENTDDTGEEGGEEGEGEGEENHSSKEISINIKPLDKGKGKEEEKGEETEEEDNGLIFKDGTIYWNNPKYQIIWGKIPEKLKTEFKLNVEWMKEFMNSCVNARQQKPFAGFCKLTTPPNIVLPPRTMENDKYDFGVSIYNKVFNSLPITQQKTYLTLYREDVATKVKNYSQLEGVLNGLVEREVGFGNGAF
jgi:hypothetical protein